MKSLEEIKTKIEELQSRANMLGDGFENNPITNLTDGLDTIVYEQQAEILRWVLE